jgi:hypothetical protein
VQALDAAAEQIHRPCQGLEFRIVESAARIFDRQRPCALELEELTPKRGLKVTSPVTRFQSQ